MRAGLVGAVAAAVAVGVGAVIQVEPTRGLYVDEVGRVRLYHGLNAVYKLAPWIPSQNGSNPWTSLAPADMANLAAWGFNVLRLGVQWDGAEVAPGVFNTTYLGAMRALVDELNGYGIAAIADVHEDSISRYYCGEGVPPWYVNPNATAYPFPAPFPYSLPPDGPFPALANCTQHPFAAYLFTIAEAASWGDIYSNATFAAAFARYWGAVATAFAGCEGLLGYELLNEPQAGDLYADPLAFLDSSLADAGNLLPLYKAAYAAVRAVDPDHIVLYEHAVTENYFWETTGFPAGGPGGVADNHKQALSYHIYCINTNATGDIINATACAEILASWWAVEDKNKAVVGGGSFLTEFGAVGGSAESAAALTAWADMADARLESWAYWSYKYYDDITTTNPATETLYNGDGSLQLAKLAALSRTYAQAIAGVPTTITQQYDAASSAFTLSFTVNTAIAASARVTQVYYNAPLHYPAGVAWALAPPAAGTVTANGTYLLLLTHAPAYAGNVTLTVWAK